MSSRQPDQQIYDELMKRSTLLGLPAFPFLPDDSESHPFMVVACTQTIPQPTKTKLAGEIAVQCDTWGNTDDRKLVSDWVGKLMEELSNIRQTDGRQWFVDLTSSTQIVEDNSAPELLYHGILDLKFKFYQEEVMANHGKDRILMLRELGNKTAAAKPVLQTEHKWKYERKNDSIAIKGGLVVLDKGLEAILSIEVVSTRDELDTVLKKSVVQGYKLEVWETDLAGEKQGEKYPVLYAQGSFGSWEVPDSVEDLETLSTEMTIEGKPVGGYVTLTAD